MALAVDAIMDSHGSLIRPTAFTITFPVPERNVVPKFAFMLWALTLLCVFSEVSTLVNTLDNQKGDSWST
jgi:hypothetical protein